MGGSCCVPCAYSQATLQSSSNYKLSARSSSSNRLIACGLGSIERRIEMCGLVVYAGQSSTGMDLYRLLGCTYDHHGKVLAAAHNHKPAFTRNYVMNNHGRTIAIRLQSDWRSIHARLNCGVTSGCRCRVRHQAVCPAPICQQSPSENPSKRVEGFSWVCSENPSKTPVKKP